MPKGGPRGIMRPSAKTIVSKGHIAVSRILNVRAHLGRSYGVFIQNEISLPVKKIELSRPPLSRTACRFR